MTADRPTLGRDQHEECRTGATVPSRERDTGSSPYLSPSQIKARDERIEEVEVETARLRAARLRRGARFLKGPIPMRKIAAAARLPGQALVVYLAIHHRRALTRSEAVTLPRSLLEELGVTKDAKARALRALEREGLVRVERPRGRSPKVSLTTGSSEDQPQHERK